ncbi:Uncharacterized protein SCF082_LOCUS20081 [Durusdinium trenchii]|uniref:C3H1-type domain-containing protein n=1 Tax=Durusdinium trenchii TaxID=1381693 RepID=A0ABP0KZY1_9DINO
MSFAAFQFGLTSLQEVLQNPVVVAWKEERNWHTAWVKEAVPLPLELVRSFERAVVAGAGDDSLVEAAVVADAGEQIRGLGFSSPGGEAAGALDDGKKSSMVCCPPAPPSGPLPLLSSLPVGERDALLEFFESNCPGVALTPETIPALQFLQSIHVQRQQKAWAWIPWRRILSEAALWGVQSRRSSVKRRDFAEVIAEAAGLCGNEWDLELAGSPHRIYQLLCTREAEEADREVLGEVFRQVLRDSVSLDTALDYVVDASADNAAKRGGLGECWHWAEGKCTRAQCRFKHACAKCGDGEARRRLGCNSADSLFEAHAVVQLQWELVLFLGQQGFPCTGAVEPHQPFLLDVWRACALMSGDIARFVARWGGAAEARARWGPNVAAGKLGVVQARLDASRRFTALSFDIRGAHKLVRARSEEQEFSVFVFEDEWFAHRSAYFGCRWAAYWFSRVCKTAARAAQLFCNAVRVQAAAPLRFLDIDGGLAAVDAFATAESGGIGGWWIASGSGCVRSKVRWFSFQINKNDLPAWFTNGCSGSLQSCIAALEAAAQLALLLARAEASQAPEKVVLKFHQLCDNAGAASAARKHLAMSEPLSFVLQATGYWCCRLGVALCPHHIAGEKNTWADDLSRNKLDGFGPALRWSVDLRHVLERPWQ